MHKLCRTFGAPMRPRRATASTRPAEDPRLRSRTGSMQTPGCAWFSYRSHRSHSCRGKHADLWIATAQQYTEVFEGCAPIAAEQQWRSTAAVQTGALRQDQEQAGLALTLDRHARRRRQSRRQAGRAPRPPRPAAARRPGHHDRHPPPPCSSSRRRRCCRGDRCRTAAVPRVRCRRPGSWICRAWPWLPLQLRTKKIFPCSGGEGAGKDRRAPSVSLRRDV